MRHLRRFILSSALIVGLALPAIASADPIQITSGSLTWIGGESSRITANSPSGVLTMSVGGQLGTFAPSNICNGSGLCTPGASVPLTAAWNGNDLPGTATFMGTDWMVGSQLDTSAQATVRFGGELPLPLDFTGGTLTAPFRFTGSFDTPAVGGGFTTFPLTGQGTATLTFGPSGLAPGAFSLTAARYDFEPTPEPASLILLGTGIAGTWATRRRKKA